MISVVIPCYNGAALVGRCLDSVLAQTLQPAEIIVVDDGSTDASADIVAGHAPRVRYVRQANAGPAAARNRGLAMAQGEYLALLDADDYWMPTFLERTHGFLAANPDAVAVSVAQKIKTFGHDEVIRPSVVASGQAGPPRVLPDFFAFWAENNHITTGSNLIRTAIARAAGGQRSDFRLCEDLEFWGLIGSFGSWGFIPEPLFVSDGAAVAAAQGWLAKHSLRWKNVPSVEQWQERILPRLRPEDMAAFARYSGRVAKMFAYARLMGGDYAGSRRIIRGWGSSFPPDPISRLLRRADKAGSMAWRLVGEGLRWRERVRGWRMRRQRIRQGDASR